MDFSQIKDLTIPEGSVIFIADSKGNILYNKSTYRELEYIHFSGAEYVDTNTSLSTGNTYKRLDLKLSLQKTTGWGSNGFDSNTNQRFYMGINNANNARFGSGSAGVTSTGFTLSTNTIYNWVLWTNNGSTDMTITDESGTQLWKSSTVNTTFASAPGKLYIGALNYNGISHYAEEKIYSVRIASNSYSGVLFYGVPCQRKSDGVCGLYDTVNDVFCPMQGTNITTAAAGPTIDENPSWSPKMKTIYSATATGGDGVQGYSNTYYSQASNPPYNANLITNLSSYPLITKIHLKCQYRCNHAPTTWNALTSTSRNQVLINGSIYASSTGVDSSNLTGTIDQIFTISNDSSNIELVQLRSRRSSSGLNPEGTVKLIYYPANQSIVCTTDDEWYFDSTENHGKMWLSNLQVEVY